MSLSTLTRTAGVRLGLGLARIVPPGMAYSLARGAARLIRRWRWSMFTVLRDNLDHLPLPADASPDDLAESAVALALRTYYELYRSIVMHQPPADITTRNGIPREGLPNAPKGSPGLVVGALHMSNFDLAGAWLTSQGFECQVLSLANPDAADQLINRLRRKGGMTVTPIGPNALRSAIRRLRAGGVIITGIDRPFDDGGMVLPFFGQMTHMPVGHVRLALQTNARFVLVACIAKGPGRYEIVFDEPMEMVRTGDRQTDIRENALAIIERAEALILSAPDQWLVFRPVWPVNDQPETGFSIS